MTRITSLLVVALFAAFTLPSDTFAQTTNVKTGNINQSTKFKSGIFKGSANLIQSNSVTSFIGAGQSNSVLSGADYAVLGGGFGNLINNDYGTVSGGGGNTAGGNFATVSGGYANMASGYGATLGGGQQNTASGGYATVGGGFTNTASGSSATVGGGIGNTVSGPNTTVGGGEANTASDVYATVGGGYRNTASGSDATASGDFATVGCGFGNTASGSFATVPGGVRAFATNSGAFVWSGDDSEDTGSFADYSFAVRCEGGARFYTADGTNTFVSLLPGATDLAAISDSNAKTKVTAIKPREILDKLSRLPVTEWQYKHNPDRRYIGPMAQDFRAAFGLGYDDKSISTLDSDGVMYAAIQGLVEELKERDAKIGELEASGAELKAKMDAMEERLNSLPPAR
jgi:hypothetical protein